LPAGLLDQPFYGWVAREHQIQPARFRSLSAY